MTMRMLVFLFSGFVSFSSHVAAESIDHTLTLVKASALGIEVTVNGVVVVAANDGASGTEEQHLNRWLLGGGNTMSIRLSAVQGKPSSDQLKLTLSAVKRGGEPSSAIALVSFSWKRGDPLPMTKTFDFTLREAPASEFWPKAKPVTLDDNAKRAIIDLVMKLDQAVEKKDLAQVVALSRFRLQEMARSFGAPEAAMSGGFQGDLKRALASGGVHTKLAATDLVLTLVGGDRLVKVTRKDGSAPTVIKAGGGELEFEAYVAPIGGVWTFVR